MRKILYLEPVGGIAGDMFLAAGIDLGVSPEALSQALGGLKVPGWKLAVSRAVRHAISGTHLDVVLDEREAHPHRAYADIRQLIEASTLPPRARERALAVFRAIGEAEAKVHGVSIEAIHFHEVGAVDSIVDICGAAVVLELLGNPEVYAAPPPLGSGTIRVAHGTMPIPVPATMELLRDVPVRFEGVGELTTPTGAALLKVLTRIGQPPPDFIMERIGYGVGTKDFRDRPNVLRATLGRAEARAEGLWVVEVNLDDSTPQLIGYLLEHLLDKGAKDVWVVPATMKKGRPGHVLSVLVEGGARETVLETLLRESTTLGARSYPVERLALERDWVEVETPWGRVRVKRGLRNGAVLNAHPEFEDCRKVAEAAGVPLKQVMAAALAALQSGR